MSNSFNLMDENPNLGNGSNGCLCSELGNADTKGPFIVFAATETDNIFAPFPVLCAGCAREAIGLVDAARAEAIVSGVLHVEGKKRARTSSSNTIDEDGPSI